MTTNPMGMWQAWMLPSQTTSGDDVFEWSMNWVPEPRLIPLRFTRAPRGMGNASFRLLKQTRDDGHGDGLETTLDNVVAGGYVCITQGIPFGGSFDYSAVKWWGFIGQVHRRHLKGGGSTGTVSALGLGNLLDGVQLKGWRQASGTGATIEVLSPPTWNVQDVNGRILGNVEATAATSGIPIFIRMVRDLYFPPLPPPASVSGEVGTRWGLLQHICAYCIPGDSIPELVPIDSTGGAIEAYLDDPTIPELIDARNATVLGGLDLCIPRPRSFGWDLVPDIDGRWNIVVYSHIITGGASGSLSATVIGTNINVSNEPAIVDLESVEDNATRYDQVTIRGGRIVFCGTLAMNDQATRGWTIEGDSGVASGMSQQTQYLTAGGIIRGTDPVQLYWQKVDQWRSTVGVADVFILYTLANSIGSSFLKRYDGLGGAASAPFFPTVEWDGTTVTTDDDNSEDPVWQTTRFMRTIPWEKGLMPDGVQDFRTPEARALPTYMPPMAFSYEAIPGVSEQTQFVNLSVPLGLPDGTLRGAASIEVDERRPGLRIEFSPRIWLAKNHVTNMVKTPRDFAAPVSDTSGSSDWALDWQDIMMTVAIESDQRVEVNAWRPGIAEDATQVRRRLIIENDKLQCWIVHEKTALATNTGGVADLTPTQFIKRNDYPLAQRLLDMAASWAFRSRRSVTLTLTRPDNFPAWATVGTMIGEIDDGSIITANTVVESVAVELGDSPRLTINTTFPEQPDFLGSIPSPTAGGPVSVGLGGTVAQAVQGLNTAVSSLANLIQSKPNSKPQGTESRPSSVRIAIVQAVHGFAIGNLIRYDGTSWILATTSTVGTLIVEQIIDTNGVMAIVHGYIGSLTGLTVGVPYYNNGSGVLTTTANGSPVLLSISATEGFFAISGSSIAEPTDDGLVFCSDTAGTAGEWVRLVDIGKNEESKAGRINILSPNAAGNAVEIDGTLVTAAGRKLTIREIDVCDSGAAKKMLILGSAPY